MRHVFLGSIGSKTIISVVILCAIACSVMGQEASENQISVHQKKAEILWKQFQKTHPDEFSGLKVFMNEHSQDAQYLPEVERLFLKYLREKKSELNSRLIIQELKVDSLESNTSITASQSASGNLKFKEGSTISHLMDGRENLLGYGAIHRWAGAVEVHLPSRTGEVKTYRFIGDENDPFTFGLIYEVGWVHLHGIGKVVSPDGKVLVPKEPDGVPDEAKRTTEKPAVVKQKPNEQTEASGAPTPSAVVARIGDYTITAEELEQRMMRELYPQDYDITVEDIKPVDAEKVLLKMIAEKAMMIEGREKGYLEKEDLSTSIKRFKESKLVGLVAQKHVEANEDKIAATEDEIKQKMLADPNVTRERAAQAIRRVKGNRLLNQYFAEINRKSNVRKLSQNFPKVVEIHQRLMTKPKKPRKVNFIRTWQVKDELTQSEKDIVLVQFDGGKVTLFDWFTALSNIVPPRRPRNLNTVTGVEQLLDRTLFSPLMVAEAKSLGLDRDETFLKEVRDYEDRRLLGEVRVTKQKETKEPTPEEILAYFKNHQEAFVTGKNLKIDVIWGENLGEARKAKAELDAGKDFESVKQQYSPDEKGKPVGPINSYPGSEGLFWKDLWVGEPNDVMGPLKGFHGQKIQWRIVKILEKNPGKPREYSENMNGQIKSEITSERNEVLMDQYNQELLKKYSYQLYADKIKGIDPLNIP